MLRLAARSSNASSATAVRAAAAVNNAAAARVAAVRPTSVGRRMGGGSAHETYREPTGNLFGEAPLPQGTKRVMEDWEYSYFPAMGLAVAMVWIGLAYKPETSIKVWATEEIEARERNAASAADDDE